MPARWPALAALLAAGVLVGCQMDAAVEVVGRGAGATLAVTYDGGKPACVQGLTVTELADGGRRDVWAVRRRDGAGGRCADRFRFGATPPGYETVVAPRAPATGRRYEVSATGVGWSATAPLPSG